MSGCSAVFSALWPDCDKSLTIVPVREGKSRSETVAHFGFTIPAVL